MLLRQYTESGNPTGTFLRWYPGSSRPGHNSPNWKVANNQTGRDEGPDDEGYKTPQSEYWNQPGSLQEILDEMNDIVPPTAPDDNGGALCACGEPDPDQWFTGEDGDEDFPIGFFGE
jgi:hypothetical protein